MYARSIQVNILDFMRIFRCRHRRSLAGNHTKYNCFIFSLTKLTKKGEMGNRCYHKSGYAKWAREKRVPDRRERNMNPLTKSRKYRAEATGLY